MKMFNILAALTVLSVTIATNDTCLDNYTCIPVSECEEIYELVLSGASLDTENLVCGDFQEPFVCCDRNCVNPNGNYGRSTTLNECPQLTFNKESADPKKRKFLLESHINKTHVCCKKDEDTYNTVLVAPIVTPPPSLSSSCITPNGERAKCVHMNSCPAYKAVEEEIVEKFRFINDSICGFWKEPMICCGSASHYEEKFANALPTIETCGVWDENLSNLPPWLTVITKKNFSEICVGALINQRYVLATTRCVEEEGIANTGVQITGCMNCTFKIKEVKMFPLNKYVLADDLIMVLLKLNQPSTVAPVCLPTRELAISQTINIVGIDEVNSLWARKKVSVTTTFNDECHRAKNEYFERIICLNDKQNIICKPNILQSVLMENKNDRWYLEGLFDKADCYGEKADYFNAIYVYKFLSWIKSNIS